MDSMSLCFSCGLCCDGSLFADVRLRPADVSRLPVEAPLRGATRGRLGGLKLLQPCFAWEDGVCSIYQLRPGHCRKFDCDLLGRMVCGDVSEQKAREIVRNCRAKADEVRSLLRRLGDEQERGSISDRFRQISRKVREGGLCRKQTALFGDLTVAVHELHCLLAEHIYPA